MTINNKYQLEQIVVLKTDREKYERIVTRIAINGGGVLLYDLSQGEKLSSHYEFEMDAVNSDKNKKVGF